MGGTLWVLMKFICFQSQIKSRKMELQAMKSGSKGAKEECELLLQVVTSSASATDDTVILANLV